MYFGVVFGMNYTSSLRDTKKHAIIALPLSIKSTEECFVRLRKEIKKKDRRRNVLKLLGLFNRIRNISAIFQYHMTKQCHYSDVRLNRARRSEQAVCLITSSTCVL